MSTKGTIDYSIIGVDEAGRGPIFGPVVAAAVFFDEGIYIEGITDSKKLSESKREELYEKISFSAKFGIGIATPDEIDVYNILHATELAMNRALEILSYYIKIDEGKNIYVDGKDLRLNFPSKCIVKGDEKVYQISAASILAKVTRDRIMKKFDKEFPEYNLSKHKGYATSEHIELLIKYGPTPYHRLTFDPVFQLVTPSLLDRWLTENMITLERYIILIKSMEVDLFGNRRDVRKKSRKAKYGKY